MEHLVRFRTAEGREGQHSSDSLDDALRFVERLRNNEDVPDVRVYRMQEVPIEFRTYYKVELRTRDGEPAPAPEVPAAEPVEEPARPGLVVAPSPVARDTGVIDPNGSSRRLFSR